MPRALFLDKQDDQIHPQVREYAPDDLPDGDVLVSVQYSSLNYKDGLAVTGKGKIVRGAFPFVPGIDLVGTVAESASPDYEEGDPVIATGWNMGEHTWGGYAQQERVQSAWLVPLPEGLSMEQAMIIGTAGFTAMLSVMALEEHGVTPERGEVVVTGASGGAGSFAVALLGALGYDVVSSTGSEAAHDYLSALGAARLIPREELEQGPERPMESSRWAGAIDAVGGDTLATLIAQMERHGSIAAFGNAGGYELHTTVFPFILRGVNLLGIDSNTCPFECRQTAWQRLAQDLPQAAFDRIHTETVGLEDIPAASERITSGAVRGRIVVDVNK